MAHVAAKQLQASGDLVGAIQAWRRIRASGKDQELADRRLANLFIQLCRSADAVPHLLALTRAEPADLGPWRDLGRCLRLAGHSRQEADAWRGLLRSAPDDPEALSRLAVLDPDPAARAARPEERPLDLAARLLRRRDFTGAAAVYASMQPGLAGDLRQARPDGRPIEGPDLLIIGAARTGTSWLARCLSRHPEIFLLAGEPQYFSGWAEQPPETYVGLFAAADARFVGKPDSAWSLVDGPVVLGEKSPTYLTMDDDRIALCTALFPDARLICLVRDPIERAWSHIRQLGHEDRAEDLGFLKSARAGSRLAEVIEGGRYRNHLRRWARAVAPDRILLLEHGRIATDPDGIYHEVLEWLGLERLRPRKRRTTPAMVTTGKPPPKLFAFLEASYAEDPFDLESLREAMAAAYAEARPEPRPGA